MIWLVGGITLVFSVTGFIIMAMGFGINAFPGTDLAEKAVEFKLLGGFFIVSPWLAILLLKLKTTRDRRFSESILKEGKRKRAVLVSCEETGTYVNNDPKVRMVMQIRDDDGSRRNQVFTGIIPLLKTAQVRPGMELEITESSRGMVIHWPGDDQPAGMG